MTRPSGGRPDAIDSDEYPLNVPISSTTRARVAKASISRKRPSSAPTIMCGDSSDRRVSSASFSSAVSGAVVWASAYSSMPGRKIDSIVRRGYAGGRRRPATPTLVVVAVGATDVVGTATVAMLSSDIEGSTRLLQDLGSTYAEVLMVHRDLLRGAFAAHGGSEQSTEGDAFFVVFPTAGAAIGAALDAQLAVARHEWPTGVEVRVRMGVHVGDIQTVAGTIVGMAVHQAARIGAAA